MFENGLRREHDVRVPRRGGPNGVDDDRGFGFLPCTAKFHGFRLVRKGIAACPYGEPNVGIGNGAAVVFDRFSGI